MQTVFISSLVKLLFYSSRVSDCVRTHLSMRTSSCAPVGKQEVETGHCVTVSSVQLTMISSSVAQDVGLNMRSKLSSHLQ